MQDMASGPAQLRAALAAAGDVAYAWDFATDAWCWLSDPAPILGADIAALATGAALAARIAAADRPARAAALARRGADAAAYACDYALQADDGDWRWVEDRGRIRLDAQGTPLGLAGVLRSRSRAAPSRADGDDAPRVDGFERARLRAALDDTLALARRYAVPGAVLALAIDRHDEIVALFGATAAEAAVQAVGRILARNLRSTDIVGRIAADRFAVVLSHSPVIDLALTAEKLRTAIAADPVDTPAGALRVTASVGGVALPAPPPTAAALLAAGEAALDGALRAGGNQFALHRPAPSARGAARRHAIWVVQETRAGLEEGRIILGFQPVVDATTRAIDHYECMLRLRRPNNVLLAASGFVPQVERSGLMRRLDRRALDMALAELASCPQLRLAVNVSGHTTTDRAWLAALTAATRDQPDLAPRLTVEITETVALQDIDETARFVHRLRDLGCRVALDDFGAGYTSFRNLQALSVDGVKIDGSFVRGLAGNVASQLFVRTLLGLADGLGLRTVAECVETEADAEWLARRGVGLLQGWLFGKPAIERPWRAIFDCAAPNPVPARPARLRVVAGGRSVS